MAKKLIYWKERPPGVKVLSLDMNMRKKYPKYLKKEIWKGTKEQKGILKEVLSVVE